MRRTSQCGAASNASDLWKVTEELDAKDETQDMSVIGPANVFKMDTKTGSRLASPTVPEGVSRVLGASRLRKPPELGAQHHLSRSQT